MAGSLGSLGSLVMVYSGVGVNGGGDEDDDDDDDDEAISSCPLSTPFVTSDYASGLHVWETIL